MRARQYSKGIEAMVEWPTQYTEPRWVFVDIAMIREQPD